MSKYLCPSMGLQKHSLHITVRATCSISTPGSHYFRSEAKMAGVNKDDSALLSKCLEFCQALANHLKKMHLLLPLTGPNATNASTNFVLCILYYKATSEKGLRQHVRMKRKEQACAKPENLRRQGDLSRSPLLSNGSKEKCQNC